LLAYFQFSESRAKFLLLHVLQTSISLIVIGALVWKSQGWQAVIVGKLIGLSIALVIGGYWLSKSIQFPKDVLQKPKLGKLLQFGVMYLPSAVYVVINGFIHAWMPWLFRTLTDPADKREAITRVSIYFYFGLVIVGLVLHILALYFAPLLIGDAFADAFRLIPWAIAGTIAMGYFFHNQAFLHYRRAVGAMSTCSLYCIVSNAVLSYYGAIHFGTAGVFYATVASFLSAAILCGIFIFIVYHQNSGIGELNVQG